MALGPIVALATTVVVAVLGIQGLRTGSHALQSALRSAGSAHELEAIASSVQGINGDLYHVLTLRGAQTKDFNATAELRPLLAESDRVVGLLGQWRDTQATPAQRPRVAGLIVSVKRYKGAVDFVSQMLDVDFVAAVSFTRPFDRNFHDLVESLNALVHEVQARQEEDAQAALRIASTTMHAFFAVGATAVLLAVFAAADMGLGVMRAHRLTRQNGVLTQLAQIDALTGLGNRRCFDETLVRAWANCTAKQAPLTLILLDIDHFKKFNDSQGHPAGDDCLRRAADCIAPCTRDVTDLAARYGGEEFAIILPESSLEAGLAVAERVRRAVMRCAIPHPAAGPPGIVTVSLGVACVIPTATGSAGALIEAADRNLYAAKHAGRNQVGDARLLENAAHF